MVKQLRTDKSLLIALDRCRPHYQVLLIIYLKFRKKEFKGCKERRKMKSARNFFERKNNKLSYEEKECKKRWLRPVNGLI